MGRYHSSNQVCLSAKYHSYLEIFVLGPHRYGIFEINTNFREENFTNMAADVVNFGAGMKMYFQYRFCSDMTMQRYSEGCLFKKIRSYVNFTSHNVLHCQF